MKNFCIVLDAGHGGNDSGGIFFDKSYEKDYNFYITLEVKNILKKYFKNVFLTRNNALETISLKERTHFFNKFATEYNIVDAYSFHCNALDKNASGTEMLLSIYNDYDTEWATYFLKEFSKKFNFKNRGIVRKCNKTKKDDYYYLHRNSSKNVKCKIFEIGFGDNEHDFNILKNNKKEIAEFIAKHILMKNNIIINEDEKEKEKGQYYYIVQCGKFENKENAEILVKQLKKNKFSSIIIKEKK